LDNAHTRGNLHRTRNQRLPAGRVLISFLSGDSPSASKPAGFIFCPGPRRARRVCIRGGVFLWAHASGKLSGAGGVFPKIEQFVMAITSAEAAIWHTAAHRLV
jgi:hypothetical protein